MVQSSGDKNKIIKQIIQKLRQQSKWLIKVLWQKIVELYRLSFWQSNDWLKYAEKQSQLGDLEGGLNACNQALKRDATNYLAWHKKGLILVKLKYDDEALASYDKALKINPNTDLVWVSKGDLLSTQQQTRAAADCYQQALKINPQNTQVTIKLNSLLEQLKQTVESLLIEGDKLYKSKDFQSATTIYQQAITLRPDLDTSWYKFGNCLFALNKYQEAINAYNQTLLYFTKAMFSINCKTIKQL
jgi:tetratricopeptide (TPR) repeat protein